MTHRMARPLARLSGADRLGGVDLARGLAVVGMLAAHLVTVDERFTLQRPETWVDAVNGRSSILFAVLAGVSIALTTGAVRPLAGDAVRIARRRLLVRAGGLWVLGILLIVTGVPVYVILPAYAVLFLVATLLLRLRALPLFVIAGALLLVMPFVQAALGLLPFWDDPIGESIALVIGWAYPFPLWMGFLVAGMALGRIDLRDGRIQTLLVAIGAGIALTAYGLGGLLTGPGEVQEPQDYLGIVASTFPHSGGLPEVLGGTGVAAAVLGACLLLCRTPLGWLVLPLRATGSMPLTAYTAQIVVWAVWAFAATGTTTSLFAFRALDPFWPITVIVLVGCTLWALLVGRGPLEAGLGWLARRAAPSSPRTADR